MHRLFVALRPPAAIRAALNVVQSGVPGARWQDDDQLHVTVRFIGAVDTHTAGDVAAALDRAAGVPVVARIAGVGGFDRKGRIDTLWAGVAPHGPLAALHRKVDQALALAGIAPDPRAYLPHVTLARLARGAAARPAIDRWLADHAALASPGFTLDRLTLFESHLGRAGASYAAIAHWPLRTPAAL